MKFPTPPHPPRAQSPCRRVSSFFCLFAAVGLGICGNAEEHPRAAPDAAISAPATQTYRICDLELKADELLNLMEKGEYAPISDYVQKLRDSRATTPGGMSAANLLTEMLSEQKQSGEWISRWLEKDPYSNVAHLLYGQWCIQEAWRWRGSGWANTVTEVGWKNFHIYIQKARENLTQAIAIAPNDYIAADAMMTVSMAQSNKIELYLWLLRATSINPDSFEPYDSFAFAILPRWLGEPEESYAFIDANRKRSPLLGLLRYKWLKWERYEEIRKPGTQDFATARSVLAQYMEDFPHSGRARYDYAKLLIGAGKKQEALPYLEKAVELDPSSQNRLEFARRLMDTNQYAEAAEQLDAAAKLAPDNDEIWVNLGLCLKKTGDNEKAVQCFTKTIAINPDTRTAWVRRGEIRMYAGQYQEAIPDFNEAIRRWPDFYKSYYYLGGCLYRIGKKTEARQAFEKAVELNPKIRPDVEEFMQRQGESF